MSTRGPDFTEVRGGLAMLSRLESTLFAGTKVTGDLAVPGKPKTLEHAGLYLTKVQVQGDLAILLHALLTGEAAAGADTSLVCRACRRRPISTSC